MSRTSRDDDEKGLPQGKKRHFHTILNMGNGDRSKHQKDTLLRIVDDAFYALGTAQQPNMSTSPPEEQEDKEIRERLIKFIEGVVEDVAMALTGEEWIPSKKTVAPIKPQVVCKNCAAIVPLEHDYRCLICGYDLLVCGYDNK